MVENREIALSRMRNALDETIVEGIKTNLPLHQDIYWKYLPKRDCEYFII